MTKRAFPLRKLSIILISLIAITGVASLTFYIIHLNQTLNTTREELSRAEEREDDLKEENADKDETIGLQTEEIEEQKQDLAETAQRLDQREEELEAKEEEIEEATAEVDRQKRTVSSQRAESARLNKANEQLKENTGTVVSCFDGITTAMVATDEITAYRALERIANTCEEAAEIVDEL